ncbi:PLP-dependent cysteine synthase family protein [Blastococcus sp. TF02A_35]|uniref:PLP-dependent cysteine synthase family protein n=1 Tax=Blastococcus sp. TF02A-35 TaxID=2559612 RepID=UPI001073CD36|nr:PLP-dependent cysteine synthase family protein [Blastococcus sp. TF02A_35]TFV52518.1 PLP-dependent cysteine synthase family protein [Blastococcus sp. TF02A_35]
MTLLSSVLDAVGGTPLVRLDRLAPAGTRLLLKCEQLNPGGSHKARIALNMIRAAERDGWLTPGSGQTILEPTGGNTGMGIAMAAAVLGYRVVLVVPDNYSLDKQRLLRALGAEVVLSDSTRGNNSHGEKAMELQFENPTWVMLNQGANPANPAVHRDVTARELVRDLGGLDPDVLVAGIGTGGHISGVGAVLRERYPALRIIGVEPEGCSLRENRYRRHRIQGLAIGYVPANLDVRLLDDVCTVSEGEAVAGMRALMRSEGICAGVSTGANIAASLRLAAQLPPDATVLTFAYDGAHDYLDLLGEDGADLAATTTDGTQA